MKNVFSTKALSLCTGLLCVASSYSAQAQNATLNGNLLLGNQSGANGQFIIQTGPNNNSPYLHFFTNDNTNGYGGSINYIAGYNANGSTPAHSFTMRDANGGWVRKIEMYQDGRMRIGLRAPTTQTDYKLAVEGKVVAQSIYVTSPSTWADFVFAPTYSPMSLPKLEQFLRVNKHLPAIPSASEVTANGYNVTDMDAKLLQSIEELTLHVIALSKEVAELKAEKAAATK